MINLLCVVELRSIVLVLHLGGFHLVFEPAEVFLAHLLLGVGLETLIQWRALSFVVLAVDG